jgi:DNA-binding CsgD family transcriptional regulator
VAAVAAREPYRIGDGPDHSSEQGNRLGQADLLRVQDVRDAYRLIGECRDLGSDPALWHRRMLEGLCRLVGAPQGSGGEGRWLGPPNLVVVTSAFEFGMPRNVREMYASYHRELGPGGDPIFRALWRRRGRLLTVTRRQVVPDAAWYRSISYDRYFRPTGVDQGLVSVYPVGADGSIQVIALQRAIGEQDFSPRQRRVAGFFHAELGRLIGRALVSDTEASPGNLPPRLRQTLACLLEGDSEKQVAARLGLSPATTHQYVTALYRKFGVQSRAQLLAHALRRVGSARWRSLTPSLDDGPDDGGHGSPQSGR